MFLKEFKNIYTNKELIDSRDFPLLGNANYLRRQVSEWVKKDELLKLRRGLYIINDTETLEKMSQAFIANVIYQPSYLSVEWALRYYQLIPEEVYTFTSVSTRKTKRFENKMGLFENRQIKKNLFWGFQYEKMNGKNVLIASPEKTLVDFLYFNLHQFSKEPERLMTYRFQNIELLDRVRINEYLDRLDGKLMKLFLTFVKMFIPNRQ